MRAQLGRILHAKSAGSAIVLTMVTNIAVQGANVASGVLTARSLGPAGRGALASIIMWPQFLAYAMTLGIPVASVYCIKRRPDLAGELSGAALFLSALFGLISAFVGMWLIPLSLHQYPVEVIHVARLWALITPLELFSTSVMSLVQVTGSFKYFNAVRISVPLSIVLALSLERLTGTLSVDRAAAAYLVAGLPVTFWITGWIWKYFKPTLRLLSLSSKQLLGSGDEGSIEEPAHEAAESDNEGSEAAEADSDQEAQDSDEVSEKAEPTPLQSASSRLHKRSASVISEASRAGSNRSAAGRKKRR